MLMPVTKKDVQARFGGKVEQVGSKQLFVVTQPSRQILVSYLTIVGYKYPANNVWLLTKTKYSTTTSKQLTQFSYGKTIDWIEQEHLEELIEAAQCN
jgi:hypothetical protein